MPKRVLYVTTIAGTMSFFTEHFKALKKEGYEIELACNFDVSELSEENKKLKLKTYNIPFSRSPLSRSNFKAASMLDKVIKEGDYDIVHCHTPNAAAITRMVCRKYRKNGLKVFYTAHGFHFYRGAPLRNWILFYPVEWMCSFFTDKLITINHEDFLRGRRMHAKEVYLMHGMGVDVDSVAKRDSPFDFSDACQIRMLSVGELNNNKNHQVVIRALACIGDGRLHYYIAGDGRNKEKLEKLAEKEGVGDRVHFLGYVNDLPRVYREYDVFIFPSIREGLGISVIEAMAAGLPIIVSNNRGAAEYCQNDINGYICEENEPRCYAKYIDRLLTDGQKAERMSKKNIATANRFSLSGSITELIDIYEGRI